MTADVGRRFVQVLFDVIEDPESADHNQLLAAASDYLDVTPASGDERRELSRRLAFAAMDLAVLYTSAEYAELRRVMLAFNS